MTTDENVPLEHQLIRDGVLFEELEVVESETQPTTSDDLNVRMTLQVDEELLEAVPLALPFVLFVLSFHDARPRGVSGNWFEDDDQFSAADLIKSLRFEYGRLHMYVDYLRGRCVKTTVIVEKGGKLKVETMNRGQAVTRWVDRVKGKHFLRPVE